MISVKLDEPLTKNTWSHVQLQHLATSTFVATFTRTKRARGAVLSLENDVMKRYWWSVIAIVPHVTHHYQHNILPCVILVLETSVWESLGGVALKLKVWEEGRCSSPLTFVKRYMVTVQTACSASSQLWWCRRPKTARNSAMWCAVHGSNWRRFVVFLVRTE